MARRVQYQVQTEPVLPPTTTTWGWFTPLSEPTRRPFWPWQPPDLTLQPIAPPPVPPMSNWFAPLSDPVRVPLRNNNFFDIAEPIPSAIPPPTAWFTPLSEPVRILQRNNLYDEVQPAPPFDKGFAPRDSWFSPLSEPVRVPPRNNNLFDEAQAIPSAIPPPTAWFSPWSEPVRVPRRNTLYDEAQPAPPFDNSFAPRLSWFRPWQDPLPVKRLVLFDIAEPITQTAVAVPPTAWFAPFSDPVRVPSRIVPSDQAEPIQQTTTAFTTWWFEPLTDPVRVPPSPVRGTITTGFLAVPPAAVSIGWYEPWSEPVRQLLRNNNLFDIAEPIPSAIPPPTAWFVPLSEPVRQFLRNTLYDEAQPIPQPAPPDSWFAPLSDPVRQLLRNTLYDEAQPIPQPPVPAPPDSWFAPLSDPVRVPRRNVLTFEIVEPIPQIAPPPVPSFAWTQALSEPVRVLPRTAFFDFTTFLNLSFITPATVIVPRVPLFQPYRPIPPDLYSWDFFNFCLQPEFMPTTYIWDVRGPEPIDQFWISPRPPPPPPPATVAQWFHGWDPPVRVPPRAPDFSPVAGPPPVVLLSNVILTLRTTERKDAWSMTFVESVTPFTARVGIVERLRATGQVATAALDAGNVGIIESDF